MLRSLVLALALTVVGSPAALASPSDDLPPALGYEPSPPFDLPPASSEATTPGPWVRVTVVDRVDESGSIDWSAADATVEPSRAAGWRVVLALGGAGGLPTPGEGGAFDAWTRFVREAAARYAGRVDAFELDPARDDRGPLDTGAYAFLIKASALAMRAELAERGATALLVQAPIAIDDLARARALWGEDLAAYVDAVPVVIAPGTAGADQALGGWLAESLRHPPAAEIWVHLVGGDGHSAAGAIGALAAGARVALLRGGGPESARWVAGAHGMLGRGFAPAPAAGLRLEGANVAGAFLRESDLASLVVVHDPGGSPDLPGDKRLVIESPFVRNARLIDFRSGEELRAAIAPVEGDPRARAVRVPGGEWPLGVVFERPATSAGFELAPEEVRTERERWPTVEEIVARYQEVERVQQDRLERWAATGRIDFHFRVGASTQTIDVSIDANFFWERGAALEWEETTYYINGNRVPWKRFPELPLIQPERVITLPLDLSLDRTYGYRLLGRERVGDRDAWVVEFEPVDRGAAKSLYRGRVFIDAGRYTRLRTTLLQTNLEPPVLSNEEADLYGEYLDAEGRAYRLISTIDGQQIWNTAGRSFIVRREVTFESYDVNPPRETFEERRRAAYASDNKMLRETPEGFRYLRREPDGTRAVKPLDTNQWFAAAGAFKDNSTGGVTPLAGANYFDLDVGGRNVQINALLGGVVNFATVSKPDLIGKRVSGTLDAFVSALDFADDVFAGDEQVETESVDTRTQTLSLRLGIPAGQFVKLDLVGRAAFRRFDDNDDARDAIAAYGAANPGQQLRFVLPSDHTELRAGVELEFARRGFEINASASRSSRSRWEPFGPFDAATGEFVVRDPATGLYGPGTPEPLEEHYTRYALVALKEWDLPRFQKVRIEADWLDGDSLDRFSRYQFSLFGEDRLSGFAGTGVRFDEGTIARAAYSFNLFEVIRFDALVEQARVRDLSAGGARQAFTGAGLAATVVGPWKTVINASYGRAIASDIPELDGSDEFLVLILKLF